jgi:hypothetical protein
MPDSEVTSLAKLRVEKSGDSREWSALDALRDVIADIESGHIDPTLIYVAMECRDGDFAVYDFECAGGTKLEYIGLLSHHLHLANSGSGD